MQQQPHMQMDTSMMYSGQQQSTPLETMSDYYNFPPQNGYGGIHMVPNVTPHNPNYVLPVDSWQNFMAQFKQ
jgi:hypothetical protein